MCRWCGFVYLDSPSKTKLLTNQIDNGVFCLNILLSDHNITSIMPIYFFEKSTPICIKASKAHWWRCCFCEEWPCLDEIFLINNTDTYEYVYIYINLYNRWISLVFIFIHIHGVLFILSMLVPQPFYSTLALCAINPFGHGQGSRSHFTVPSHFAPSTRLVMGKEVTLVPWPMS